MVSEAKKIVQRRLQICAETLANGQPGPSTLAFWTLSIVNIGTVRAIDVTASAAPHLVHGLSEVRPFGMGVTNDYLAVRVHVPSCGGSPIWHDKIVTKIIQVQSS